MNTLQKIRDNIYSDRKYLTITKFEYLKTPVYSWTFHNQFGGSFSNSGQHLSLKACANHAFANTHVNRNADIDVRLITVHGFDENDKAVETESETILLKLIDKELLK